MQTSCTSPVIPRSSRQQLEMERHMLLAMDPPNHTVYRRPMTEHFKARVIANMEDQIRELCRSILADADGEVEFVHDVTSQLPSRVIGQLMGLPEADWPRIHALAEQATSGQDPELAAEGEDAGSASIEIAMYAIEFAARRRTEEPQPDLTSVILDTTFGDEPMNDIDFGSFFAQLVIAGNDTTKIMLSSGLSTLLDHPDQLEALRADPSLTADAVEEILRYANPLHYFRRTATRDTTIGETAVAAGDKVAMYYTSANRDEAVFDDPQTFDIRRRPNPHLSFGIAAHHCLGVHLARLEGRVFFEELFATFPNIERTGAPVRIRSNLNNGLKVLPVRLTR